MGAKQRRQAAGESAEEEKADDVGGRQSQAAKADKEDIASIAADVAAFAAQVRVPLAARVARTAGHLAGSEQFLPSAAWRDGAAGSSDSFPPSLK